MMRAFLWWLTARLPVKVIGRDAPYVEWYHVATLFGLVRIQINRFTRSDPDGLHDHPWGWSRSVILIGSYYEERRDKTRKRTAGSTYGMTGDTFHRVILPGGRREVWSLFFHGPYVKHWGFITPAVLRHRKDGPPIEPSWNDMEGATWYYTARPRSASRFDDWHLTAPKGREIREAA